MVRNISRIATLAAVVALATACSSAPTGPTAEAPKAPTVKTLGYDINIPVLADAMRLRDQYPAGIAIAPIAAQERWDYTRTYQGSPNVYFGPTGPLCEYVYAGIVVAPYQAASKDTFTSADWPTMEAGVTWQWVGRFVYTMAAAPGTYKPDPTGSYCSSPRK